MKFQLNQLKIENLASNFNDGVIDLTPPFQRGRGWTLKMRQGLLKNILQGKPVPAIFLYKTPVGAKFNYAILDGKQRLESILLYIGAQRGELKIANWTSYIFGQKNRKQVHFSAEAIDGTLKTLRTLSDGEVVRFRDYSLSIIEIDFDDQVSLEEIIQLFVDINQYGVKVKRFDIVKALYRKDPLLRQIFELIAMQQKRGKDIYFKPKRTAFTSVLKKLDAVSRLEEPENKVDLMWERLVEFALYAATAVHRKPSEMLKDFISRKGTKEREPKLTSTQMIMLTRVFRFLADAYKASDLYKTRLATDQTHFYIMVAALIEEAKVRAQSQDWPLGLVDKLIQFDALLSSKEEADVRSPLQAAVSNYLGLSEKQTTDAAKRRDRVKIFRDILAAL